MSSEFEPTPRWSDDSPFRDDAIVADGRRESLLKRRRDELANMSQAIGSVYVARSARAVAALFASVLMLGLVAASALPEIAGGFSQLIPARNPAVLSTLLFTAWIGGGLAYFLFRARAERRFAHVMSRAVRPTNDVHADVERLSHVMPERLGRDMAQRREASGIALPVLAAAILLPCSAIYLCMALVAWGYPRPAAFDDTLMAFAPQLVAAALLGIAAAVIVVPRLLRFNGSQLVQVRNTAFVVLLAVVPLTLWGLATDTALAAWPGALASALSILTLIAAQRVRSERVRLGFADDSTVAELTFRDVLRAVRATLVALPSHLNPFTLKQRIAAFASRRQSDDEAESPAPTAFSRPAPKAAAVACVAAILGTVAYTSISPAVRAARAEDQPRSIPDLDPDDSAAALEPGASTVRVIPDHDDERQGVIVEIQFRDGDPAEWTLPLAQPGAGFGWQLAVSVTMFDADIGQAPSDDTRLLLTPFVAGRFSDDALPITRARPVAVFNKMICDEDMGLGLRIVPQGDWATGTRTVRLRYEPFMSLTKLCEPDSH